MMYFSPRVEPGKGNYANFTLNTLLNQVPFPKETTIHSTQKRQTQFNDNKLFGTIRKTQLHNQPPKEYPVYRKQAGSVPKPAPGSSNKPDPYLKNHLLLQQQEIQRNIKSQGGNKPRDLWITIEENSHGTNSRPVSIIGQSRPQSTMNGENVRLANYSIRPKTVISGHGHKQSQSMNQQNQSYSLLRLNTVTPTPKAGFKVATSPNNLTAMTVMLDTKNANQQDFADDHIMEKHQNIKLLKVPPKGSLNIFKLSDFDVKLIPSDSRRMLLEALMRDYLLSLIPENSDFFIYRNSQSNVYNIIFTGGLVPVCRLCNNIIRMEASQANGFQVLCSASYCKSPIMYKKPLSEYVVNCLWPSEARTDIEPSVQVKKIKNSKSISMQIQNGAYKKKNFNQIVGNLSPVISPRLNLDYNSPANFAHSRPQTTTNQSRTSSRVGFKRILIRSALNTEEGEAKPRVATAGVGKTRVKTEEWRPMTAANLAAGKANTEGIEPFRGEPLLQNLGKKGLFAKQEGNEKEKVPTSAGNDRKEDNPERIELEQKLNLMAGKGKLDMDWSPKKQTEENEIDSKETENRASPNMGKIERGDELKEGEHGDNDISMEEITQMVDMITYKEEK